MSAEGHVYPVVGTDDGPEAKTKDCIPKIERVTRVSSLNIVK